jgi:hypothetical protein
MLFIGFKSNKFVRHFKGDGTTWNEDQISGKPHHGAIGTRHS